MTLAEELKLIIKAEGDRAVDELKKITEEIRNVEKATEKASGASDKAGDSQKKAAMAANEASGKMKGLATNLAITAAKYIGLGVAAKQAMEFVASAIKDAEHEYRTLIGLNKLIENVGEGARLTSVRIDESASAVESAVYADKTALMDATQEIITYEGLALENLERIHMVSADISVTFSRDIGSSLKDLSKWLSNPAKYLTRMERSGITISESAKEQILSLDSQNRKLEAQTLLLDEIEKKVGGVAEKAAEASPLAHLDTAFNMWKGSLGRAHSHGFFGSATHWLASIFEEMDVKAAGNAYLQEIKDATKAGLENLSLTELDEFIYKVDFLRENNEEFQYNLAGEMDRFLEKQGVNVEAERERLSIMQDEYEALQQANAEEAERNRIIAEGLAKKEALLAGWSNTPEGQRESLQTEIGELQALLKENKGKLKDSVNPVSFLSLGAEGEITETVEDAGAEAREAIEEENRKIQTLLDQKIKELAALDSDTVKTVLGQSLSSFLASDIDTGYDWGLSDLEKATAEAEVLKGYIDALWSARADAPAEDVEELDAAIKALAERFGEIAEERDRLQKDEDDKAEAERLILSLKSEETREAEEQAEHEKKLKELLDSKLLTEEQYNALLEKSRETITATERALKTGSVSEWLASAFDSYDFGSSDLEKLEQKIPKLKSAIESLWKERPEESSEDYEQWKNDIDELRKEYDEALDSKKALEETDRLRAMAEEELLKLLDEEEQKNKALEDYSGNLNKLLDAKLISEEQYLELLEMEKKKLGLIHDEEADWQDSVSAYLEGELKSLMTIDSAASGIATVFQSMGTALAEGTDVAEAAGGALASISEELFNQLPQMFISAGLRCIIEGGWAGLGPGLALLAMGGLTGIAAGAMGAHSSAVSDEIMEGMQDELEARQTLAKEINKSIDTEYELLKRQLERNLIGVEEFREGAGALDQQRKYPEAQEKMSSLVLNKIQQLNAEYQRMSGWDKFWGGRDEEIEDEIDTLQTLFDSLGGMSKEELRAAVATLEALGISTKNIPAFAKGGEFETTGPRLIMVGDNPGGRERVKIRPISGQEQASSNSEGITVQVYGDVYGLEDLYGKLELVGAKKTRRSR